MQAIHFSSHEQVDAICAFLKRQLARRSEEWDESPVVGLFGRWGAGKTRWLKEIEKHFIDRIDPKAVSGAKPVERITVPVLFNAWRYENEPHLIVPLLKVTQYTLDGLDRHYSAQQLAEAAAEVIYQTGKKAAGNLARLAKAAFAGTSIQLKPAEWFEIGFSGEAAVAALDQQEEASAGQKRQAPELFGEESLYFNFQRALCEGITRPKEGVSIDLIFLIDDLDRCLPEKAVEMLEVIKLFLDVEGTAFVIAVDDEVVERGIQHRYRDYLRDGQQLPITGHEYLEKIIHLPVRVPLAETEDTRTFLIARYPKLFQCPQKEDTLSDGMRLDQDHVRDPQPDDGQKGKIQDNTCLLTLFEQAVPPYPRKLIRAAELLKHQLKVAENHKWSIDPCDCQQILPLALLTLIQLFDPELYRWAKHERRYNLIPLLWRQKFLERKAVRVALDISYMLKVAERIIGAEQWEKLLARDDWKCYFLLRRRTTSAGERAASAYHESAQSTALVVRNEQALLQQLRSPHADEWINALAQLDLKPETAYHLPDHLFEEVKRIMESRVEQGDHAETLRWLQVIERVLSPQQLHALMDETDFLKKLQEVET